MKATLQAESNRRTITGELSIKDVFQFAVLASAIIGIIVAMIGIGWPLRIGLMLHQAIRQSTDKLSRLFQTPSNGISRS